MSATRSDQSALTSAGRLVVMEKISQSASTVKSADIIVAKMITHILPIHRAEALVDVYEREKM